MTLRLPSSLDNIISSSPQCSQSERNIGFHQPIKSSASQVRDVKDAPELRTLLGNSPSDLGHDHQSPYTPLFMIAIYFACFIRAHLHTKVNHSVLHTNGREMRYSKYASPSLPPSTSRSPDIYSIKPGPFWYQPNSSSRASRLWTEHWNWN
jgi:hypothetical protein